MISFQEFTHKIDNNEFSLDVTEFITLMNEANEKQHYLNDKNFKTFQEYQIYCKMLKSLPADKLNSAQAKVIDNYDKNLSSIINPIYASTIEEDGGTPLVYKPNGFITAAFIIGSTVSFGLAIAYMFISAL